MEPQVSRKRRRRRRIDRPAISARLLIDERLKGEIGILSEDLFDDLFPSCEINTDHLYYVAITPWIPASVSSSANARWTILPVKVPDKTSSNDNRPHSSLQFPAAALALQSFVLALQSLSPNKTLRRDSSMEISILDVAPVGLDTVYVNLDTEALQKLDEVHAKFGGGFGIARPNGSVNGPKNKHLDIGGIQNKKRSTEIVAEQERSWKKAVKDALRSAHILHIGDMLPLPLPAHPITHAPPPPAKITACDPVSQGLLLPTTKVVVLQSKGSSKPSKPFRPIPAPAFAAGVADDEDDTSNEQFYSAAEERNPSQTSSPPDEEYSTDHLVSEASESEAAGLSDDDPEDMISLDAPMLPPQQSGVLSSYTAATPRPGGFHTNGVATPGSVFSSFTATTARGLSSRSRLFKTHGLLERIPDEMIHPRPGSEDDEEARIYVDTNSLVKLGCFSGDWVKIEAASAPSENSLAFWGVGAFGTEDTEPTEWRSAKVFGLPDNMSKKPQRYPVRKNADDRRSSISGLLQPTTSSPVYLSPVLLANLGEPSHLRISALLSGHSSSAPKNSIQKGKVTSSASPPVAKEAAMLKLNAPLSVERVLQPSLFAALKEYFERKRRIVKTGDIVGISIDESLGKAIFQGTNVDDDTANEELLSKASSGSLQDNQQDGSWKPKAVAWFKVGIITKAPSETTEGKGDDLWGGAYVVDATSTKMVIKDSEQGRVPTIMNNPWQYYLGAKRPLTSTGSLGKGQGLLEMPKAYISPMRRRLRELMSAATSSRAIHLGLPPLAVLITSSQRQVGKATVAIRACEDLGLHTFSIDAFDIITDGGTGGGDVKTAGTLEARAERGLSCGAEHTALLVKHVDALNADRMITSFQNILGQARVLIATTTDVDKVPDGIRGLFTHELEMSAPDEGEREGILRSIVADSGVRLSADVDLANIAMKTAALVAGDLVDVVDRAIVAKHNRLNALANAANKALPASSLVVTTRDIEISGGLASNSLTKADFEAAVDAARKNFADAIGAPKIPNVSWSDVGGLTHVKDAVMETIQLPLARPELFAKGMKKRSGILFYGPPGTGKTLLAKAIATEFSLNFFSVKGPELLNMYIGESEANVRRVFQRARDARPCVVFFDELDSVAPKRGNQGDSGGVMDRIVSQLLAELDGMSNGEDGGGGVFVIGATNRPDLLDQALLRPGRFDKMLYLGVSDTHNKQLTILEALTRKFTLSPNLSLSRVAETLPFTYTGADLYALCSDAMLKAITRRAMIVDEKVADRNASLKAADPKAQAISVAYFFDHLATEEDTQVMVEEEDFWAAKRELVPSVSAEELGHYDRVRRAFEGAEKAKREEQERARNAPALDQKRSSLPASKKVSLREPRQVSSGSAKGNAKNKGKGKDKSSFEHEEEDGDESTFQTSYEDVVEDQADSTDGDDNYIIHTGHLEGKGNGSIDEGKGKGSAKSKEVHGFGDAADGDEDMYA